MGRWCSVRTEMSQGTLWTPSPERAAASAMAAVKRGLHFDDDTALWKYRVTKIGALWAVIWSICEQDTGHHTDMPTEKPVLGRDADSVFNRVSLANPTGFDSLIDYAKGRT